MKINYFRNIAGTMLMAVSIMLGVSSLTSVQAQYPYPDDRYRQQQDDRYRRDQDRYRQQQQDERWRQQNDRYRQQNDRWRRDQNQDWRRRGSYDSYPNWGGWEFRQTALNAGYNEGLKQGRNDRNRRWGGRGDFRNSSAYRNADKDYNSRFRDRELYRRYFQMAFETGYRDGLNGY